MSAQYKAIQWNTYKIRYDVWLFVFIAMYVSAFASLNFYLFPYHNSTTIFIRAFGTLAIIMLHVVLMIGPLCRINKNFLPLLYNRRHLGVATFIVALVHAVLCLNWFHAGGNAFPLQSLFTSNTHYLSFRFFPFQVLGFFALCILMLMAFTSHDFWLNFFSPRVWKYFHMLVYVAYALVIMHVALGVIQFENSPYLYVLLFSGAMVICILHLASAIKEWRKDVFMPKGEWQFACRLSELKNNRAKIISLSSERIAVYRYGYKISAVHNVCKHQQGPLGEGKIVDGCITCPWHGYQYQPHNGCAPAPFTEKLHTYRVKLESGKVFVNTHGLPEGTEVEPAIISENNFENSGSEFFIGWQNGNKKLVKFSARFAASLFFIALLMSFVISTHQYKIAVSNFDYENPVTLSGSLLLKPFPALAVLNGKDVFGNPQFKLFPLVNEGKFGADDSVRVFLSSLSRDNANVMLTGNRITRDNYEVIEILKIKLSPEKSLFNEKEIIIAEDSVVNCEIIDPKCYFGAMNPGEGKPHRSCAIRCISGGIMPVIKMNDGKNNSYAVLAKYNQTKPNKEVLDFIAEPVSIKGTLKRIGNWQVFYFENASSIKRKYQ